MITEQKAREIRVALLTAFDVYKSNVQYGIETETPAEHEEILDWYNSMLDLPLDIAVYKGSPAKIMRYLPKIK